MRPIDEKIISMQLENSNFEQNARQSLGTLQKLTDATNNDLDQGRLASSVDKIADRFSNLGIIGMTALQNITNKAVDAGLNILKSFTISPVTDGFREYETKMKSIQMIMANTGSTDLEPIKKSLNELNEYADKTIYNFSEMTRNIGTFTAAGIDLETAKVSIQGIANLAAMSGSTSQQASTAMYQLSQALSAGSLKLQDWNSVVNAGMGGKVFQEALKNTAKAMGIIVNEDKSFRESLKDGWITTEVLTRTLEQMTMATENMTEADIAANREKLRTWGFNEKQIAQIEKQANLAQNAATKVRSFTQLFDTIREGIGSGWAQIWEFIIGDFDEATERLTKISEGLNTVINGMFQPIIGFFDKLHKSGAISAIWNSFFNVGEALGKVLSIPFKLFNWLLPKINGSGLITNLAKGLEYLTSKLVPSEKTLESITNVLKVMLTPIKMVTEGLVELAKAVKNKLVEWIGMIPFDSIKTKIKELAVGIGNFATENLNYEKVSKVVWENVISLYNKASDTLKKVFTTLTGGNFTFQKIGDKLNELKISVGNTKIWQTISNLITNVLNKVDDFRDKTNKAVDDIKSRFKPVLESLDAIRSFIGRIFEQIGIKDILGGGMLVGLFKLVQSIKKGFDTIVGAIDSLKSGVKALETVFTSTTGMMKQLKKNLQVGLIKDLAFALILLAGAMYIISKVPAEDVGKTIGLLISNVVTLVGLLKTLETMDLNKFNDFKSFKLIASLIGMSFAISTLAGAIAIISKLDQEKSAKNVKVLLIALGAMLAGFKSLTSKDLLELPLYTHSIKQLGKALTTLTIAFGILSFIPVEKLQTGATVLVGVLWAFSYFAKTTSGADLSLTSGAIVALAVAINMLIIPIGVLGKFKLQTLAKGLGAVGAVLTGIALFAKHTNGADLTGTSLAILAIAAALTVLVVPIGILGKMPFDQLVQGIGALAAVLLTMVGLSALMGPFSVAMTGVGKAVLLFGAAVGALGAGIYLGAKGLEAFMQLGPTAANALIEMVKALALGFLNAVPTLVEALLSMFKLTLIGIKENISELGQLLIDIFIKVVNLVAENIGPIMAALTNLINKIGEALKQTIANVPIENLVLSVGVFGILAVVMKSVQGLGPLLKGAIIGIGAAAAVLAEISIIMAGLGWLYDATGVGAFIDKGAELLRKLGDALGGAIGAFIGAFLGEAISGVINRLPGLTEPLTEFGKGFKDFLDVINTFPSGSLESAQLLVGIVGELVKITAIDALVGWLLGEQDFGKFGEQLSNFGTGLVSFASKVSEADFSGIQPAVDAATKLVALNSQLDSIGGVVGFFMGERDMGLFGSQLEAFGTGLVSFANTVKDADYSGVQPAVDAATKLVALNAQMEDVGGVIGFFAGEKDMKLFGENLPAFGTGLKTYADTVKGLDLSGISASVEAASKLVEINNNMENQGGLLSWFMGDNTLDKFGEGLAKFGAYLLAYSNSLATVNFSNVRMSSGAIKSLSEATSTEGISDVNGQALEDWGWSLTKFGEYFISFHAYMTKISVVSIVASMQALKDLIQEINTLADIPERKITRLRDSIKQVGNDSINEMQKVFPHKQGSTNQAISKFIDNLSTHTTNRSLTIIKPAGSKLVDHLLQGIRGKYNEAYNVGITLAGKIRDGIGSVSLYDKGYNAAAGMARGLRDGYGTVYRAAASLAYSVSEAIRDKLDIHSPSRVTYGLIGFAVDGAVNRLHDGESEIYDAGVSWVDSAMESLSRMGDMFREAVDDEFDYHPTITPVLDMSNVRIPNQNGSLLLRGNVTTTSNDLRLAGMANHIGITPAPVTSGGIVNHVTYNNQGLLDGAVFHVREEADINKIARGIKQLEREELVSRGYPEP